MTRLRDAFERVLDGASLSAEEAEGVFGEILDKEPSEAQVAGFLVALKLKGESAEELTGGARAMRERSRRLALGAPNLLDTAGTGGDGAGTFNVSTGAALVAAAAGVPVAKHGNRAVTGKVGGADVLEHSGVRIELDPDGLAGCLKRAGICFIFAPAYHPVLARLGPLRRALGTRTMFNLAAPLANPANPSRQLLGVSDSKMVLSMARALSALGVEHAMVVRGEDGLDEISLSAPTEVAEVTLAGGIREYRITPESFGFERAKRTAVAVACPDDAVRVLRDALSGKEGAARDMLALNGGAAIYLGDGASCLADGVAFAREILATGRALKTWDIMRQASLEAAAAT